MIRQESLRRVASGALKQKLALVSVNWVQLKNSGRASALELCLKAGEDETQLISESADILSVFTLVVFMASSGDLCAKVGVWLEILDN